MKFDPSKPVQTRDGRKARIIAVNRLEENYPIIALVVNKDGEEDIFTYTSDGRYSTGDVNTARNLINIPEKHVKYINIYPHFGYQSRVSADEFQGGGRTACIRIEYEDGQFDE